MKLVKLVNSLGMSVFVKAEAVTLIEPYKHAIQITLDSGNIMFINEPLDTVLAKLGVDAERL